MCTVTFCPAFRVYLAVNLYTADTSPTVRISWNPAMGWSWNIKIIPFTYYKLKCRSIKFNFEPWMSLWDCSEKRTCSELLCKRMNFPSTSSSSMQMLPVAEAAWAMLTLLLASDSSTSTRFLFPRVVRTLRLEDARDTVTRDEGLGDSFNLAQETCC